VCQLDALRECLARNVPQVLSELPDSLDETYERILRGINKSNRNDVHRLLQCLVVSLRPLRVEELAEVCALDFDNDDEIPKLIPDWRWEDQEQTLQAACSSLISIVNSGDSRVVQFSHFSAKEYLTSPRLAKSRGDVSWCHVSLEPAHTILAKACLGVLLLLDDTVNEGSTGKKFPLARYAAENWVSHAQFDNVSLRIQKGMKDLFNPDKPHFAMWVQLHDIDTALSRSVSIFGMLKTKIGGATLYYAALCGFQDLAEHLIVKHSQDVNRFGGIYRTPLLAALAQGYSQMAESLFQHGADVNRRSPSCLTPLHYASSSCSAYVETMQWLLSHGADPNAESIFDSTPLHMAASWDNCEAARILLDHNADIDAQDSSGETPLSWAVIADSRGAVRLLLSRGADVNVRHKDDSTPLHLASGKRKHEDPKRYRWSIGPSSLEAARTLLNHGADVGAEDNEGRTAFHIASSKGHKDIVKLLLVYGAK
jgi:ankyrin repeat protein